MVAHVVPGAHRPGSGTAHPIGGEQSNTSVVVGGTHVLKVLRRLHAGGNPEVEIGRHLAAVAATGCAVPVPALAGWYELHEGERPPPWGCSTSSCPARSTAWALVLSALAGDPDGLLARLWHLGATVAALHGALARPGDEPGAFGAAPLAHRRGRGGGRPAPPSPGCSTTGPIRWRWTPSSGAWPIASPTTSASSSATTATSTSARSCSAPTAG